MLHLQQFLDRNQQEAIAELCRSIARLAPMLTPTMPSGANYRYQSTSCGVVGWISDRQGYRYSRTNPANGKPFPPMPIELVDLAHSMAAMVGEKSYRPDTCLINFYRQGGRLGLHQDNTEYDQSHCIISISLGDDAIFTIGGTKRSDPTRDLLLRSGDALILHGESRLAFHGIKRIIPGTSNLLKNGGRLNLTIRQVYD